MIRKGAGMTKTDKAATDAWGRYEPSAEAPWDLRRVVHLHRRAGLGASRGELERDLKCGPEASVARLLEGKSSPAGGSVARRVRAHGRPCSATPRPPRATPAG